MDRDTLNYIKELEDNWNELREYFINYREEKQKVWLDEGEYERYCVALSIDDILKKMDEIEKK